MTQTLPTAMAAMRISRGPGGRWESRLLTRPEAVVSSPATGVLQLIPPVTLHSASFSMDTGEEEPAMPDPDLNLLL